MSGKEPPRALSAPESEEGGSEERDGEDDGDT
jgi:hypothetical protein